MLMNLMRLAAEPPYGASGRKEDLPLGDLMLAQKLALELDERAALAVANRRRY
jgi:hypothetical protein